MTSLEILDHLIRYVRLREDLHIVLALERRDAGCRQCRSAKDPRVAGDLLGAGPTAHRLLRRRRAAQSPRLPLLARNGRRLGGRACLLCPGASDVDLLSDGQSVVDLDAEIAHGALDLGVPQQ
jgi:hypothetical protein